MTSSNTRLKRAHLRDHDKIVARTKCTCLFGGSNVATIGAIPKGESPHVEQLFGSKTRLKLLDLFYRNPNRSYYVREITRKIDEQINSVRRELANLLSIGIVKSENRDNRLYYEVNQKYKHYDALSQLFVERARKSASSKKTNSGTADTKTLRTIKGLGAVDLLVYLGSFTQDTKTEIDVLVVGDVNKTQVHNYIADLEDEEGRELKYVVMATDEFRYRRDVNDRFVTLVDAAKKVVIHDPIGLATGHSVDKKSKKG